MSCWFLIAKLATKRSLNFFFRTSSSNEHRWRMASSPEPPLKTWKYCSALSNLILIRLWSVFPTVSSWVSFKSGINLIGGSPPYLVGSPFSTCKIFNSLGSASDQDMINFRSFRVEILLTEALLTLWWILCSEGSLLVTIFR